MALQKKKPPSACVRNINQSRPLALTRSHPHSHPSQTSPRRPWPPQNCENLPARNEITRTENIIIAYEIIKKSRKKNTVPEINGIRFHRNMRGVYWDERDTKLPITIFPYRRKCVNAVIRGLFFLNTSIGPTQRRILLKIVFDNHFAKSSSEYSSKGAEFVDTFFWFETLPGGSIVVRNNYLFFK